MSYVVRRELMPPPLDVCVTGSRGIYTISIETPTGKHWARRNLSGGERSYDAYGNLVCEGGNNIREIVAAMVAAGLRVEVNGQDMTGYEVAS